MTEIRRHSVDVPITRTLVALRRVRSLRDPCTNSMSKFASLLENVKWETGSNNGISLQFESCSTMEGCDLHKLSKRLLIAEGDESPLSVKGRDYGSPITSYGDEDVDFENESNRGCGIASCWSRTPRYRSIISGYIRAREAAT